MDTLISSWGFSSYVQVFEDNKIDVPTLHLLNFEALSALIPPIGDRLKFCSKLEDFKKDREVIVDVLDGVELLRAKTPELLQSSVIDASSKASTEDQRQRLVPVPETPNTRRRVDQPTFNPVLEYLKCPKGERVLNNYFGPERSPKPHEEQSLDVTHQNLLVEIIIDNELKTSNTEISAVRLEELSRNIEDVFPNEKKGIYFIPYSSKRVNGKVVKKHNAQGKLWWKYNNNCKVLLHEGTRIRRKVLKKDDISVPIPESLTGTLLWLEGQLEITENLVNKWKETAAYRYNLLLRDQLQCDFLIQRSGKCVLDSYFNKYPFLRQPGGYALLEQDFLNRYPECGNKLFDKWPQFREKVLTLSGKSDQTASSDASILFEFCKLVTSVQRSRRVSKKWVANAEEITEGFLLHVKVIDSCDGEINRIIQRAQTYSLHVSPFAIVVGTDIENITDSYICLDGVQFRVASPLHAIDQTFKAIHALHAVYQQQSISTWMLLQRVIYNMSTEWDSACSVVEGLLHKFM